MHPYVHFPDSDRRDLCNLLQIEHGITPDIVEKDIWVCIMLDYLFNRSEWKNGLVFKGGTSLSKAFHIIERFSEDIDIILDWRLLGYKKDEPWDVRSNTKQDKFLKSMNSRTVDFLKNDMLPVMNSELANLTGLKEAISVPDRMDASGPVLLFKYPRLFDSTAVLPEIRLEIGALAEWDNPVPMEINSLVNECRPDIFKDTTIHIPTIQIARAFWEKATIAHKEANRPESLPLPPRYARHYYDLHCIYRSELFSGIVSDPDALKKVIKFNNKFYRTNWADYDAALEGKLNLSPSPFHLEELKEDYELMKGMIYGYVPEFDEMLDSLAAMEKEANYMIGRLADADSL